MAVLPDIEKLCMNCMNTKPNAALSCPHCGFPAGDYAAVLDELPARTILFGRYLLGRMAGRGNMGILYAAYDLKRCQRVTIREYFPKAYAKRETIRPGVTRVLPVNGEAASPFQSGLEQSELKAQQLMRLGALSGLFVPKKCFSENGTSYSVFDYVQGIPLRKRIENNGGPYADAADLLRPVAASLAQMHGAGLSHGELSSGQVLLTSEGALKLLAPWGAFPPEGLRPEVTAAQDTRALCAALYMLLAGREPPPLPVCKREKDIPSLVGLGVTISRQKEHAIYKGLCGGYRDARELHWALYRAAPAEAGRVSGQDNNATASLQKAVKTISNSGGGKKAQPVPGHRNGIPLQAVYAAFSALQLAAGVFFAAQGGGYAMYAMFPCAVMNGLRLLRFTQRPFGRVLHLALAAGAAVFAGYALFAQRPENGMQWLLAASVALLLLNAVCVLIEIIHTGGVLKKASK